MADFEQTLQNSLFSGQSEKSFIDKLLAKQDVDRVRELIRKNNLSREDLLELLYLLSGNEAKLLNYGEWDRYIILKFFVWIREFVKVAEIMFDYQEDLKKKENTCKTCKKLKKTEETDNKCDCAVFISSSILSDRTKQLLHNNERYIEHNVKFLVDLYFNIGRTTLSLGATGIMELLKNKYEVVYPQQPVTTGLQQPVAPGVTGLGKGQ